MTNETYCSRRLGSITHRQFQTALDRFQLGRLVNVEPIIEGGSGQNVFLRTENKSFVFRGCPHYPWQFPKEKYFADLLHHKTSVAVPWPYLIDNDETIFGWPYAIMARMPGLQLSKPEILNALSQPDRKEIAVALGITLGMLQELTCNTPGNYNFKSNDIIPIDECHHSWVSKRIFRDVRVAKEVHRSITDLEEKWALRLLEKARPYLTDEFTPVFVMQDFREGNVVVDKLEKNWQITGVFDLMESYFSDGEIDLCRNMSCYIDEGCPKLAAEFIKGYRKRRVFRPGYLERFPVYVLLDRLIIWNFLHSRGIRIVKNVSFRDWVSRYINTDAF